MKFNARINVVGCRSIEIKLQMFFRPSDIPLLSKCILFYGFDLITNLPIL